MAVFVSFGRRDWGHHKQLVESCRTGKSLWWTVNRQARPGDRLLFYFTAPESAFVALGRVLESARPKQRGPWRGTYGAEVVVDEVFPNPVPHREVRRCLPAWGFSRRPTDARVPEEFVPELLRLLGAAVRDSERIEEDGGFSTDSQQRRRIERMAVAVVTRHFRSDGWRVTDRQADRCGYDLLCERGDQELHVEVKGTAASDPAFLMTEGEVACAQRDPCFRLCVVTDALDRPVLRTYTAHEMFEAFELRPIEYRATLRSGLPPP